MKLGTGTVAILALLLAASPAGATVLRFLDIPELAERSTAVIQGQVVGQRVVNEHGHLWTDSQIKVSETIQGQVKAGKIIVLRTLGGETANRGELVAGMARFHLGEQVLVFARAVGEQLFVPTGACLGKFRVYKDADGEQSVRRDLTGAAFARFDDKGRTIIRHGVTLVEQKDMKLAELLEIIAGGAAKGGAK